MENTLITKGITINEKKKSHSVEIEVDSIKYNNDPVYQKSMNTQLDGIAGMFNKLYS